MTDVVPRDEPHDDDRTNHVRGFTAGGGRVVGGVAGAAVGLLGGPVAALAGGAAGAAIGDVLASASIEFYDRHLARRQSVRAAGALAVATVEINDRLAAGEVPRQDFTDDTSDESDAAEVLEGTLLTAANSFEQRKVPYIGKFYANVTFSPSISASYANLMLMLLDRLTYGQCRVMATLGNESYLQCLIQVGAERNEGAFRSAPGVIAELDELSTMGLVGVHQTSGAVVPPTAVIEGGSWDHMDLYRARLTPTGTLIHDLLGLGDMPDAEQDAVVASLRGKPPISCGIRHNGLG
jgi:hypothetical protein